MLKNIMSYSENINIFEIDFTKDGITDLQLKINSKNCNYPIHEYPVLYILKNDNEVYIGETTNIISRLSRHISDSHKIGMETAYIFSGEYFNQSLAKNIEKILVAIFNLQHKTINDSDSITYEFHNYYNKKYLLSTSLNNISSHLKKIFTNISFTDIFNQAIESSKVGISTKFSSINISQFLFNKVEVNRNTEEQDYYPCVYILRTKKGIKKETVYIGETSNASIRLHKHLTDDKKKKFADVILIRFNKFNKSAVYDIETSLLNYFLSDEKYEIHNDKQKKLKVSHSYFEQTYYHINIFQNIWQMLLGKKIVDNTITYLKTKDIFKISPFKSLTASQNKLKEEILNAIKLNDKQKELFIIKGEAGSGKSVLLSSLYNEILDYYESNKKYNKKNYLLVNHEEMLKTYELMATSLPLLVKKNIKKPTSFINKDVSEDNPAHITIIDEGHTLLSSPDGYNCFPHNNHLEEIIKRSTKVILVFDEKQFLKMKSYWDNSKLDELKETAIKLYPKYKCNEYLLKTQLRMNCSQDIINWIDSIVQNKDIKELPPIENNFELKIFNDCSAMYEEIKKKNNKFKLSRLVATFDYLHKKDDAEYYIEEGSLKLPWNVIENEAWAQRKQTINQIGSIYTIQGFDLNYVGVIFGPSLSYDSTNNKLKIDTSKYQDTGAFTVPQVMRERLTNKQIIELKERIILNSLNVLMKRPIKGLYIYASDKELREFLDKLRNNIKETI